MADRDAHSFERAAYGNLLFHTNCPSAIIRAFAFFKQSHKPFRLLNQTFVNSQKTVINKSQRHISEGVNKGSSTLYVWSYIVMFDGLPLLSVSAARLLMSSPPDH